MSITRDFKLSLVAGRSVPLVINANQYDEGEIWRFTLLDENGQKYSPSTGSIIGLKSDGHIIANAGTVSSTGLVIIPETEQMTASPGKNFYELLIDDDTHGTANFVVFVEPRPGAGGTPSDSDLAIFQEAIDAAATIGDVADLVDDVAVLEARMDEFARLPDGSLSTAADAELVDIRVGADGTTYTTAGDAVRGQVSDLKNALNYTDEVIRGVAYNPYTWEAGTYISIAVGATIRKENSEQYINIRKRFVDITTVDFSSTITMNSGYLIKLFEVDANNVILSATDYTTTVNLQTGKRYAALLKATGDADISNVDVSDMLTTSIAISQIEQNRQDIQEIKSVTDELAGKDLIESVMVTSVNLYDNSTSVIGSYIKTGGSTVSGANYAHTGLITLESGDYVAKNYYNTYGGNGDNVYLYDENGSYKSYLNATAISGTDLMTFHLDEKSHVRLNTSKADAGNNFMVVVGTEASDYPAQFVPYSVKHEVEQGISLNDTMREEVAEIAGETSTINPLHGKAISFIGDSICAGAGYAGGYGGIIAQENEMTYQNVGVSGATIAAETYASGSPRAWICRRIDQMSETAEYAILEGGVNDASLEVTLGEISNGYYTPVLDDTTFYGAFESCLKQMTIRFPGKKIGYIIPHQMANGMRPGADYYNAVIACCKKWGVPVLDLSTEIPPFNFFPTSGDSPLHTMRETYTASGDGWHPTEAGYRKYYVDKITAWLKSL